MAVFITLESPRIMRVAVRDRGSGLSSDQLAMIFKPFFTSKREGLGLGLSISRSIIEMHGGRLWAENNADQGATFYFTLPVGDATQLDRLKPQP
ncbi:ATP-binding protein [Paraburkholderia pallida]|nr:ATP-binding protein [Paraburkholderia pallida]